MSRLPDRRNAVRRIDGPIYVIVLKRWTFFVPGRSHCRFLRCFSGLPLALLVNITSTSSPQSEGGGVSPSETEDPEKPK